MALDDLRGQPRLFPVRTLLPPQTGELPTPEALLAELRRDGIRSLRAFPSEHRYRLDGLTFGPHLEMLAAHRIPLLVKADCLAIADLLRSFIGFKFLPDYHAYPVDAPHYAPALAHADIYRLCVMIHTWGGSAYNSPQHVQRLARRYPNARLLMGHAGFGDWQFAAALARDCPNVYLDLTAVYAAHDFSVPGPAPAWKAVPGNRHSRDPPEADKQLRVDEWRFHPATN